jgi:lipoate-protein ligase A
MSGVLSLVLVLAFSSTVSATSMPSPTDTPNSKAPACEKSNKCIGKDFGFKKLLTELKISKEDVQNAKASGKNFFDLAKEKGYTPEQVKDKLLQYETEAVNKAVSDGNLTKEKAADIISRKKEKLSKWDGSFEMFSHKTKGFKFLKNLGITREEVKAARSSGKTIFDLAKEKKNLSPDQVKEMMIKEKTEDINKKVSEGKITKEKGEEIISRMKTRIQNWDGKLKE